MSSSTTDNKMSDLEIFALSQSKVSHAETSRDNYNIMASFLNTMKKTNQVLSKDQATLYAMGGVLRTILRPVSIDDASERMDSIMRDQRNIGEKLGLAFQPVEMNVCIQSDKERLLKETQSKLKNFGIETSAICQHPNHKKPYMTVHVSNTDPAEFIKKMCQTVTAQAYNV
jgi:hypothetical protein